MTIRLAEHMRNIKRQEHPFVSGYFINSAGGVALAGCDTEAEAEQAKRAFEQVLAPRFTRDEAIAIVRKNIASPAGVIQGGAFAAGVCATIEALAAAGVFVDVPRECPEPQSKRLGTHAFCLTCDKSGLLPSPTTADKLDAAGIR